MKRFKQKLPQIRFHFKVIALCFLCGSISVLSYAQDFDWVKRFGLKTQEPNGLYHWTIDRSGNVFTAGKFADTISGISTANLFPDPEPGSTSLFVSKTDANGNFVWAKKFSAHSNGYYQGGNNPSMFPTMLEATSITTDQDGSVLIAGHFRGHVAFEAGSPIPGITSISFSNNATTRGCDIFILKIDPLGNLIWAKTIGSPYTNQAAPTMINTQIATDRSGKISLITSFRSASISGQAISPFSVDFNPETLGSGLITGAADDGLSLCLAKFNNDGSFVYAKKISTPPNPNVTNLAVNATTGDLYASGGFAGTVDFDPGTGTTLLTSSNLTGLGASTFLLKLDANGQFVWVFETFGYDITSLVVDALGNILSGGYIAAATDFDWSADTAILAPEPTEFGVNVITKHDSSGTYLWAKGLHGGVFPTLNAITIDTANNIYGAGNFLGEMPLNTSHISNGGFDIFLIKLDPTGNYIWSHSIGGEGQDRSENIKIDTSDNIYLFGKFEQTVNFAPTGEDTVNLAVVGDDNDAFILKWEQPTCNTFANLTVTECDSFTLDDQTYTASGTYTHIMTNAAECDSVITVLITINNTPDLSVSQSGDTLTAMDGNGSYQWLDCSSNVSIPGATQQTFAPSENGSYAVIITGTGGCSDTSDCYVIDGIVGISPSGIESQLSLYPNPTRGMVTLNSSRRLHNAQIRIANLVGQTLITRESVQGNTMPIDVSGLEAGWYVVEVTEDSRKSVLKFIKM